MVIMTQTPYSVGCQCRPPNSGRKMLSGGICHCMNCRKHHGAVFHTFAVFPEKAVQIEKPYTSKVAPPNIRTDFLPGLRLILVRPRR